MCVYVATCTAVQLGQFLRLTGNFFCLAQLIVAYIIDSYAQPAPLEHLIEPHVHSWHTETLNS